MHRLFIFFETWANGKICKISVRYSFFILCICIRAFEDPRFSGITESEIPKLQCTVSILHTYEKVANVYDWEVGTHGISIDFKESRHYSATFLPEVAEEQKWTKEQTIKALINKAGYNGEITKYNLHILIYFNRKLLDSIETERYQSARVYILIFICIAHPYL